MSDSVKVAVRIRPLIPRERDSEILWTNTDRSIQQKKGTGKFVAPYNFDRVFGISETTADVYNEIAVPIIAGAMLGFNGTIFAYGQTSSGKTFTMMGNEKNPGIIPGVVTEIFDTIENNPEREYLIRVSYLEIYNENITDLLVSDKKPLDVREDPEGKVFVSNLTEELVNTKQQIFKLMSAGDALRHVGATNMNESSSRSHAIFRIIIESRIRDQEGAVMVSQLNLVDLAGSEKAKATGTTGQRLTEGGFINKSLFILGNVISQLSDNNAFVSYRDSRLTRILQNSLGGNSKTAIICNISPAALEETHSSLRFATNAKRIKNTPIQNEVLSDEAMMQRYKKEIDTLKKKLQQTRNLKAGGLLEVNEQLQQQLAAKEAQQAEQEERINRLTALICVSSQIRPTTPGPQDFAAKRKRRETWCPGKAGKAADKPSKSLPTFEEALECDDVFSSATVAVRPVYFKLPDTSPEVLPDLNIDISRFSNEDLQVVETGCQTESFETYSFRQQSDLDVLAAKEHQIQELTTEVENLTRILDDNLQEVGVTEAKLNHEVYSTKERLQEVENINEVLREKLAAAEEHGTLLEQQLHSVKAEKTKPSARMSSVGGLDFVQQQLEQLRAQVEEKTAALEEKDNNIAFLKTQHNNAVALVEEAFDEVKCAKEETEAVLQEREGLKIQLQDLRIHVEKREEEFKETEEFLQLERGLQDNSIMYRQYGEDLVTDLQRKVSELEKTSTDSQTVMMDLSKKLATSNTEIQDLQVKLTTTENELKQLTNEKADFEMYQDLEREKHKCRETELTAQLEEAYRENAELRSASGTSVMGQSLDMSLQAALACHTGGGGAGNLEASMAAADNLQVVQLHAQIADLQEQLSRLAGEIEEVRAERENAVTTVETMKGEVAKMTDEQASLQEQNRMLEQNMTKLQEEKLALEEHHKQETEQMNKSKEEERRLETEKLALESDKQDLEKERALLAEEKACLGQEKITFNEGKQVLQEKSSEVEEDKSVIQQQKAVLVEERESLEQEKATLEEDKLKIQRERVVIEEAKESLELAKNTLDSEKEQVKNLKTELEEDRLAFEEDKIMEKEMQECIMEEERKRFEEKKGELEEERRLLEKEREEIETERVKSSDESSWDPLAEERKLIAMKKLSLEEEQKTIEEMLNSLEEERKLLDVEKEALAAEKFDQKPVEEERNMLQLEKRAMDEYIASLEVEIKALKEERDSQQRIASTSDDVDQYKEKIAALEKDIEDVKKVFGEEKEQLQKEGNISEQERMALEKELDDLKKTYEEEKEQIQKQSQLSDEEKDSLLKELEELKKASADEKEMMEKENGLSEQEKQLLEEENKTLEEERKSLELESHKTAEECESLKDKLNGLEEERKDLLAQLQEAHGEVVQLKEELSQLQNEWSEKKEQLAEEEIERREIALSELRTEFKAQSTEDKEQAEKELQEQILVIRAEATVKLEEAKQMLPAEDLDETAIMVTEVQLEMARAELERVNTRVKQRELDLQQKLVTITKQIMAIKSLEEKKEEDQETIQTLHEEIENLQNGTRAIVIELKEERDIALNNIKEMQEEVDRLTKREEELEQQAELHAEEVEQLNECMNEQRAELTKEQEHVGALEDQLINLKTSLATLSRENEEEIKRLTTELELKRTTLTNLEDQLSTFKSQTASAQQVATLATTSAAEVAELQQELEECKERLTATIEEIDSQRELMDGVDEEAAKLRKGKQENESLFKKRIEVLEDQLSTFKSQTASAQQVATLGTTSAAEVAELQQELEKCKTHLAAYIKERDSERQLVSDAHAELEEVKKEKQRTESPLKRKIDELQDQLSIFKSGKASVQHVAISGTASAEQVAKLETELKDCEERLTATIEEIDSQRKLMDGVDEEAAKLRKEKQENESLFKKRIEVLEDQLSTFKSQTASAQQVATLGTTSAAEVAELQQELEKCKTHLAAYIKERDSERQLVSDAHAELEEVKKEKQRTESPLKRKIDELQDQLSIFKSGKASVQHVAISGTASAEQVAKLETELKDCKERLTATIEEVDSQREIMDGVDEEAAKLRKEKQENESLFKKRIEVLEDQLLTFKSGTASAQQMSTLETTNTAEVTALQEQLKECKRQLAAVKSDGAKAVNETDKTKNLKTLLTETEIQKRKLQRNNGVLAAEIRKYKEHVSSMRSQIRRLQNNNSDSSFLPKQQSGRSLPAPQAPAPVSDPPEPAGIIRSLKVLELESDNARLQRELRKVTRQLEEQQQQMEEKRKDTEKYHKWQQEMLDGRAILKNLPNGASPTQQPTAVSKSKTTQPTAGATKDWTEGMPLPSRVTTITDDPYAASLGVTTYNGVLLEEDAYVALFGGGGNDDLIRDLYFEAKHGGGIREDVYKSLFMDENEKPPPKPKTPPPKPKTTLFMKTKGLPPKKMEKTDDCAQQ